jgi:hypothetical protein
MVGSFRWWSLLACASIAASMGTGCEDEQKKAAADAGVPDASRGPVLDPALDQALAGASSGRPAASGAPSSPGAASSTAPPENGIFAPGKADALQATTAPSKIELIDAGAGDKVTLAPKLDGSEQKQSLTIAVRSGQRSAMPTIEFSLAIKADKPKEGAATVGVLAKVIDAAPPKAQVGQLPKQMTDAVGKLKGSTVRWQVSPATGAASAWAFELAKDADKGLELVVATLTDALAAVQVPVPDKPVGVGAYWMVADRANPTGMEVLRYRVFRLQKVEGNVASLAIELRQYATADKLALGGPGNQQISMELFESQGKGSVELPVGGAYPRVADLGYRSAARVKGANGQGLEIDSGVKLVPLDAK